MKPKYKPLNKWKEREKILLNIQELGFLTDADRMWWEQWFLELPEVLNLIIDFKL
jgi:hypothetical protein